MSELEVLNEASQTALKVGVALAIGAARLLTH
jgi:hypothetical protein